MDTSSEEARLTKEKQFWDRHTTSVWGARRSYSLVRVASFEELCEVITYLQPVREFFGDIRGRRILDLACGDGWISWSLGKSGAFVTGCDISIKSIEVGARIAKANGLGAVVNFDAMICEDLGYKDNFFDCVIMHAALHHCSIEKTVMQIHRVLKPGGKAALVEDYGYHPVMNLYRRLTPRKHTEDERALTDEDLAVIVAPFSEYHLQYFGICNLCESYQHSLIRMALPLLRNVDGFLYRLFPAVKKYSKLVEVFLVK